MVQSIDGLGVIAADRRTGSDYEQALTAHRQAHVLWENLAVSENSMGFHNFEEATASMKDAEAKLRQAIALEGKIAPQ